MHNVVLIVGTDALDFLEMHKCGIENMDPVSNSWCVTIP